MINLMMQRYPDGTSVPICLEIEEMTYTYPEDKLFEKLESLINYKINVTVISGASLVNTTKIIKSVTLGSTPKLELE